MSTMVLSRRPSDAALRRPKLSLPAASLWHCSRSSLEFFACHASLHRGRPPRGHRWAHGLPRIVSSPTSSSRPSAAELQPHPLGTRAAAGDLSDPAGSMAGMRLQDRCCEVCGHAIDPALSSFHLARLVWLCSRHGAEFHASLHFNLARHAPSFRSCWALVDDWLHASRAELSDAPASLAA